MATYEEIHGKRVETFSSDPTLDSSYGDRWGLTLRQELLKLL